MLLHTYLLVCWFVGLLVCWFVVVVVVILPSVEFEAIHGVERLAVESECEVLF